jgi:hypothetical protein
LQASVIIIDAPTTKRSLISTVQPLASPSIKGADYVYEEARGCRNEFFSIGALIDVVASPPTHP